jgi:hypothetical protein
MTKPRHTNFSSASELASIFQRVLGRCCYYSDLDDLEANEGSTEMFVHYTYTHANPEPLPVAVIDWKYPGKSISTKYSPIKLQKVVANKLEIPFFITIAYLDVQHPIKCYYVIPVNSFAIKLFRKYRLDSVTGEWFSLRKFCMLQHLLRNRKPNWDEKIDQTNAKAAGLPLSATLGDLPDDVQIYPLPTIEIV